MAMLPLENALATHVYWACGDWPTEAKLNLVEAIQAALKEQRDVEREACAKIADEYHRVAIEACKAKSFDKSTEEHGMIVASGHIASAIRSRTEGEWK